MKTEMKKADAGTPATKNKQHNEHYHKDKLLSSLNFKEKIGEFLWFLYSQRSLNRSEEKKCLAVFDSQLRNYLDTQVLEEQI